MQEVVSVKIRDFVSDQVQMNFDSLVPKLDTKKWDTKTFFKKISKSEWTCDNDFIETIFDRVKEYIDAQKITDSEKRGRLRDFRPITEKGYNAVLKGKILEVPLERALSKVNGWRCQFPLLSGVGGSKSNRKTSVDLVVGNNDNNHGTLIELKAWNGVDTPLFAAIELLVNFFCFVIMRKKDNSKVKWPSWKSISLVVLAPKEYFDKYDESGERTNELFQQISESLNTFWESHKRTEDYGIDSVKMDIKIIDNLNKEDFIEIIKRNEKAITEIEKSFDDSDRLKINLD